MASHTDSVQVKALKEIPALNLLRPPSPGLRAELRIVEGDQYTADNILRGFLDKADDVGVIEVDPFCKENKCGMVWRGYINIPETGAYRFWTESDDGSLLSIDGELIVDNNGDHGMTEKSGIALLQQGWHGIRIIYFNSGGNAGLNVRYAPLGEEKRVFERSILGH